MGLEVALRSAAACPPRGGLGTGGYSPRDDGLRRSEGVALDVVVVAGGPGASEALAVGLGAVEASPSTRCRLRWPSTSSSSPVALARAKPSPSTLAWLKPHRRRRAGGSGGPRHRRSSPVALARSKPFAVDLGLVEPVTISAWYPWFDLPSCRVPASRNGWRADFGQGYARDSPPRERAHVTLGESCTLTPGVRRLEPERGRPGGGRGAGSRRRGLPRRARGSRLPRARAGVHRSSRSRWRSGARP